MPDSLIMGGEDAYAQVLPTKEPVCSILFLTAVGTVRSQLIFLTSFRTVVI